MQAVVLVGGFGTRLGNIAQDVPKPMVAVCGKPFLEYIITMLKRKGITEFVFCTGHLAHKIKEYFKDGSKFGVSIQYAHENIPLHSAGALKNAESLLEDTFFVINGDDYYDTDYKELFSFHKDKKALCTIATTDINSDIGEIFGNFLKDEHGKVVEYYDKSRKGNAKNVGIFVLSKDILRDMPIGMPISLEKEIIPKYVKEGRVYAKYDHQRYVMDIGTPKTYKMFIEDVKKGKIRI